MTRVLNHARNNLVAYLALFVALGGTSYAAVRLPANSVGSRQLKNHSITPVKFSRGAIGGYVRLYAEVSDGVVITASPSARVTSWNGGPGGIIGGTVEWRASVSDRCVALATAQPSVSPVVTVSASPVDSTRSSTNVTVFLSADARVNVAVICPQR
jgi:hypothetical protein